MSTLKEHSHSVTYMFVTHILMVKGRNEYMCIYAKKKYEKMYVKKNELKKGTCKRKKILKKKKRKMYKKEKYE